MYMMTDCMHTSFPLTRTACGGIGVGIIHMAPAGDSAGDSAGDGVRRGTTIAGTIPVIGVAATGVAIGATIITTTIIIIRIIPVTVGAVATGEAVMDGMAQADVIRGYMPEDTPTAMALHAQAGIIM